jgi:hypothetical protein
MFELRILLFYVLNLWKIITQINRIKYIKTFSWCSLHKLHIQTIAEYFTFSNRISWRIEYVEQCSICFLKPFSCELVKWYIKWEEKTPESLFIMLAPTIPVTCFCVSVQNENIQTSVQNALGNTCHSMYQKGKLPGLFCCISLKLFYNCFFCKCSSEWK